MRWTKPKNDETRIRSGFLWFPRQIGNEVRWLEFANWQEKFFRVHTLGYWRDEMWLP